MATARPVTFLASKGTTNATNAVEAAFWDEGLPAVAPPGVIGFAAEAAAAPLSSEKVDEMLSVSADWRLAVIVNKDTTEVLDEDAARRSLQR